MTKIFINLKRFEVPRNLGGVCPVASPTEWIEDIIENCCTHGFQVCGNYDIVFFLPESLLVPAIKKLQLCEHNFSTINIGCQSVFREDVAPDGNFGAFTTSRPAKAMKAIGCTWTIIGHSEERRDIRDILLSYDPNAADNDSGIKQVNGVINNLMNKELLCALKSGLHVCYCIGETADEKGNGSFDDQKQNLVNTLQSQIVAGLKNVQNDNMLHRIVIGYEPIWAIGPNKIPPDAEYIAFVSKTIKKLTSEMFGVQVPVVFGGGVKKENAREIGSIMDVDGVLIALTRFKGTVGFELHGLREIVGNLLEPLTK